MPPAASQAISQAKSYALGAAAGTLQTAVADSAAGASVGRALTKPAGLDQFEARARLRMAAGLAALQPTEAAYESLVASLRETAALLRAQRGRD